ncbi:MAG: hypothetical protein V2A63_00070, partial [Patescibacteria group bacterium]
MQSVEQKEHNICLLEVLQKLIARMQEFDFQNATKKLGELNRVREEDGLALFRKEDFRKIETDSKESDTAALSQKIAETKERPRQDDRAKAQILHLYTLIGSIHREQNNFAGFLAGLQKTLDFLEKESRDFSQLRLNLQMRIIYAFEQLIGYAITYSHDFDEALSLIKKLEEKIEKLNLRL